MKTLAAFVVVCVVLAALAGWYAVRLVANFHETPAVEQSATAPASSAAHEQPSSTTPEDVPAPPPDAPPLGGGKSASQPARQSAAATRMSGEGPTSEIRWVTPERRKLAERLSQLRSILADDPFNEAALRETADVAARLDRPDEEARALRRWLEIRDEPELRLRLAVCLMRMRKWLAAAEQLETVVAAAPRYTRAWYNLAVVQQRLGRLHQALRAWDRVVALAPDNADAHANRGAVLLDLQRWAEAEQALARAWEIDPEAYDALANRALALEHLGRAGYALTLVEQALARRPRHVELLRRAAELCLHLAEQDAPSDRQYLAKAEQYVRRGLAIVPDDRQFLALLELVDGER